MTLNLHTTEILVERMSHVQGAAVLVRKTKLPDQMRQVLRSHHYSRRTKQIETKGQHFHKYLS